MLINFPNDLFIKNTLFISSAVFLVIFDCCVCILIKSVIGKKILSFKNQAQKKDHCKFYGDLLEKRRTDDEKSQEK